MPDFFIKDTKMLCWPVIIFLLLLLSSCGKQFVINAPKDQYFLYKNKIEIRQSKFTKTEKQFIVQRLFAQIDENAKIKTNKKFIFFKTIKSPAIYDSSLTNLSAKNMSGSLYHLGYYNARVDTKTDTSGKKITVKYIVKSGSPTLIDTLNYRFIKPDLQSLGEKYKAETYLKKNTPITKTGVITEINRIVDSFRNNGYYKITAAEFKAKGDTSIEALTSVSDDPFEQLNLLAKAQARRENPKIRMTIALTPPADTTKLIKYHVGNIVIIPDYQQGDDYMDTFKIIQNKSKYFEFWYHKKLFNTEIFDKIITMRSGDVFNQSEYYKTLYNISKAGVWQTSNIYFNESKDSFKLLNMFIAMVPVRKYGFESSIELSYSAASNTSNIVAGNLFGLSGNVSITNRNLAKQAIRMTHNIRAGLELNNNTGVANSRLINSNELSYSNNTFFPGLLFSKIPTIFHKNKSNAGETFISSSFSYNQRINLFNLRSFNASFGWTGINKKNWKWTWSPLNTGFSNLFNQTDSFRNILKENPFLRSSYNTAFVAGMGVVFSKTFTGLNHPNSLSKELITRFSLEESGLTWGLLPIFNKYKRRYIKADAEVRHSIVFEKSVLAFRGLVGMGVPLLGSDTNRTLPFFKQYFGGGSNSMRAWPVRGIGPGGRGLVPFSSTKTIFNDRTGDIQLELNAEYRYDIAQIIPNTLKLKGAIFTDIGNVWNLKNTKTDGSTDTTQFSLKNFYSQLGVAAGTGLRLDFNYFVVRLDFGFRFKRPELYYINDGWKAPDIRFNDVFKKLFTRGENDEFRKWRYENFNFTIGIGYAF